MLNIPHDEQEQHGLLTGLEETKNVSVQSQFLYFWHQTDWSVKISAVS